jgi:hypothetical protein
MSAVEEIAARLWRWTARHPDWHPSGFGAEVASFALTAGDELLLLDPLLPDDHRRDAVQERLDGLAADARAVHVLITIPYHVRSAEVLAERYDGRIWGPPKTTDKLDDAGRFTPIGPDTEPGPAGVQAFAIGRPQRTERPLWIPSHQAIAFGDAIVTAPDGELRLWAQEPVDDRRTAFYRDRFVPTLAPLRDLPAQRILTTHGAPILTDAAAALATALGTAPWHHRG